LVLAQKALIDVDVEIAKIRQEVTDGRGLDRWTLERRAEWVAVIAKTEDGTIATS
jgi:hypothetical protein